MHVTERQRHIERIGELCDRALGGTESAECALVEALGRATIGEASSQAIVLTGALKHLREAEGRILALMDPAGPNRTGPNGEAA